MLTYFRCSIEGGPESNNHAHCWQVPCSGERESTFVEVRFGGLWSIAALLAVLLGGRVLRSKRTGKKPMMAGWRVRRTQAAAMRRLTARCADSLGDQLGDIGRWIFGPSRRGGEGDGGNAGGPPGARANRIAAAIRRTEMCVE